MNDVDIRTKLYFQLFFGAKILPEKKITRSDRRKNGRRDFFKKSFIILLVFFFSIKQFRKKNLLVDAKHVIPFMM